MTARIRLTPTLGGNKVRFCLSNENGSSPLVIDQASIARAKGDSGAEIVSGSSIPVTFNGSRKVAIPAGGTIYCDPVDMEVRALEDLCVTYYAQDFGMVQTMALYGATTYLAFGNHTEDQKLTGIKLSFGTLVSVVPLLSGLDVYADADAYSIVVIGDSTTSNDIPKLLAKRIMDETGENKVGVLQKSIVGNCLLSDGVGPTGSIYGKAMIDRFQKDALDQPGVKYTLVKIGLNDILHPRCYSMIGLVPGPLWKSWCGLSTTDCNGACERRKDCVCRNVSLERLHARPAKNRPSRFGVDAGSTGNVRSAYAMGAHHRSSRRRNQPRLPEGSIRPRQDAG